MTMNKQEVIAALKEHLFLSTAEAEDLSSRLPDDVAFADFVGVLKTELGDVSSADLADALGISVSQLNGIQRITAAQAGVTGPGIGGVGGFIGDILGSRPMEEGSGRVSEGQEPFDKNETARLLTAKFFELKAAGAFTRREEVDLELAIQGINTREDVDIILGQMVTAGVDPEDLGVLATEFKASATNQQGLNDESRFIAENQPRYQGLESLDAEQQAMVAAGLTPSGQPRSGDYGSDEDAPKGLDRLRYYKDEDFILDRSTGKVMSEAQWAVLKGEGDLSDTARAEYVAIRDIGAVATSLIESGKFSGDLTRGVRKEYVYGADGKPLLDARGNPKYRMVGPTGTADDGTTRAIRSQPNTQYNPEYIWKTEGAYDPIQGRYVTKRVRVKNPDYRYVSRNFLPVEDIALPTPVVTEAWQAPSYDYAVGAGRAEWLQFTPRQRTMRTQYMEDVGILSPGQVEAMGGYAATPLNFAIMDIWENVSSVSSQLQYSQFDAMNAIGVQIAMNKATQTSSGGYRSGGSSGPTYSVPASLREVPDYKTLAERTKSVFSSELGREMEDWELAILSDELGDKYAQANRQRINIHKDWWNDSVSGGTTDVDFTEVEEPEEGLMFDIGEKYESEINRNVRVEDRANNRNLLMNSIAVGERMI